MKLRIFPLQVCTILQWAGKDIITAITQVAKLYCISAVRANQMIDKIQFGNFDITDDNTIIEITID